MESLKEINVKKKFKTLKVGDYIWYINRPYMTLDEGSIIKILDESTVKVCPVDGERDLYVSVEDIKDKE